MKKIIALAFSFLSIFATTNIFTNDNDIIRAYLIQRLNQDLTQKQLAQLLFVDSSTISRFVRLIIRNSPTILNNARNLWPELFVQQQEQEEENIAIPEDPAPLAQPIENVENELPIPNIGKEEVEETISEMDQFKLLVQALTHRPSKIKEIIGALKLLTTTKAPIAIAYREEGNGKGAFFDHYTMQRSTNHPTHVVADPDMNVNRLRDYINSFPFILSHGANLNNKKAPEPSIHSYEEGLLFIPGRTKDNEYDLLRTKHEQALIKQALLRGQPILAICAGSWQLWTVLGGATKTVKDHNYNGGMVRISEKDGRIIYNKQIHNITVPENSLLYAVMKRKDAYPLRALTLPVNSVHWKAPNEANIPSLLHIVALAHPAPNITTTQRTRELMAPENNTVEAFESINGAPLMGIQWHPEAYNDNDPADLHPKYHLRLLQFMAKAGDAYNAKRRMLQEYSQHTQQLN